MAEAAELTLKLLKLGLNCHSAEYFVDTRDYWWNLDFLELIGKRLSLDRVQDVLDVEAASAIGVSCSRKYFRAELASKVLIAIRFGSKRQPRAPRLSGLRTASAIRLRLPKSYRSPMRASIW
jgi:hypothetical protein